MGVLCVSTKPTLFKPVLFIIVGLIVASILFASYKASENSRQHSTVLEGPKEVITLYQNNCMQCHGNELQGQMGPESNLQRIGSRHTKEEIVNKIQNGGKRMPPLRGQLNNNEIDKMAHWLANKK